MRDRISLETIEELIKKDSLQRNEQIAPYSLEEVTECIHLVRLRISLTRVRQRENQLQFESCSNVVREGVIYNQVYTTFLQGDEVINVTYSQKYPKIAKAYATIGKHNEHLLELAMLFQELSHHQSKLEVLWRRKVEFSFSSIYDKLTQLQRSLQAKKIPAEEISSQDQKFPISSGLQSPSRFFNLQDQNYKILSEAKDQVTLEVLENFDELRSELQSAQVKKIKSEMQLVTALQQVAELTSELQEARKKVGP